MRFIGLLLLAFCVGCVSAGTEEGITFVPPKDAVMKYILGYEGSYAEEFGCEDIENLDIKRPEEIDTSSHAGVVVNIVIFNIREDMSDLWVSRQLAAARGSYVYLDPKAAPLSLYGGFHCQSQNKLWVCYTVFEVSGTCAGIYEDIRFVQDRFFRE